MAKVKQWVSSHMSPQGIVWGLLIFLALVWGLSFILIKKALPYFSSWELGAARIFIAAVTLSPWSIGRWSTFPRAQAMPLALSGVLGYLFPAFIFAYIGGKINSSLSGTLNATTPVMVLVVGALFFAQRIQRNQISGLALGFLGSLVLVFSGGQLGAMDWLNPYAALALLATVMYGFNGNIIGKYLGGLHPMQVSAYSLLFAGCLAGVVLLATGFFAHIWAGVDPWALGILLILGALNSGFAAVLFNYVIQKSNPVFASSVTYLIPVVALFAGFLDGEKIQILHFLGMGIILVGVYLINKK